MTTVALLRAKQFVARYGLAIAAVLAVVGILLVGIGGVTYATPPTTEVTESTDRQTIRSAVHTEVTASGDTALYDAGTELTDQPVYLFASSETVTVEQRTAVPANQTVDVQQNVSIRYRIARNGATYWTDTRVLATTDTSTSTGTAVTTAALNMSAVRERLAALRDSVGQAGVVDAHLVVSVTYDTTKYAGSLSETASLSVTSDGYQVGRPTMERTHSQQEARRVTLPTRNSLAYLLPLGAGALLLVAAAGVVAGHHRGFDEEAIEGELATRRYQEWISTGTIPESFEGTVVAVDSLAGLVDTAIDSDSRVIHDEDQAVFAVLDGQVVYLYSPDSEK
jgi:hypothetical protein